jgi:Acyl-CoA carboxylase epsilon subunit
MSDDPAIRIVRGVPSDEELAAIVGVLLTRSAPPAPEPAPASRWAASGRPGVRSSWRASALPRPR